MDNLRIELIQFVSELEERLRHSRADTFGFDSEHSVGFVQGQEQTLESISEDLRDLLRMVWVED